MQVQIKLGLEHEDAENLVSAVEFLRDVGKNIIKEFDRQECMCNRRRKCIYGRGKNCKENGCKKGKHCL